MGINEVHRPYSESSLDWQLWSNAPTQGEKYVYKDYRQKLNEPLARWTGIEKAIGK